MALVAPVPAPTLAVGVEPNHQAIRAFCAEAAIVGRRLTIPGPLHQAQNHQNYTRDNEYDFHHFPLTTWGWETV